GRRATAPDCGCRLATCRRCSTTRRRATAIRSASARARSANSSCWAASACAFEEESVTLRIVSLKQEDETILELHGWVSGREVAELLAACAAAPLPLRIDLANVACASAEGVLALRELRARGARLVNASPYLELLLGAPNGRRASGGSP